MDPFVKFDARSLAAIGKELRTSEPAVYRALRKALLEAGEAIKVRAQENASWSTRIPGTIRVGMRGVNTVTVSAGGGQGSAAPHAKPYEHAGSPGKFRHPVFADASFARGQWTWEDQEARPFLHPAQVEELPITVAAIEESIQAVVDEHLGA